MFQLKSGAVGSIKTDMLVFFVCEDAVIYHDDTRIDLVDQALAKPDFSGKKGDELTLYGMTGIKAPRVCFMGLGKQEKIDAEGLRSAAGRAVKKGIRLDISDIAFCIPSSDSIVEKSPARISAIMEGAGLANHCFGLYKKDQKHKPLSTLRFYTDAKTVKANAKLAGRIDTICKGTHLARDWVSMPPNEKRPDRFARSIMKLAKAENLESLALDEKQLRKNKMHALLAVGAGSASSSKLVVLDYRPDSCKKTIVLVGKGVTFDSGGINLKTSAGLTDMKMDMAGAAAVAATLITGARLKLGCRIIGVIPIVENMPSGAASRPGDIVMTHSGKSVEITNTDAEGRLILADAISYAAKQYSPDMIIDMATLTGACIVALGEKIAGVFSSDEALAAKIVASGRKTSEHCWALPLPDDYKKELESDFADIKNAAKTRYAGAITGALFLSEFTRDARWAHIDIAGPAYTTRATDYCNPGGTGFGVRLLLDVMETLFA